MAVNNQRLRTSHLIVMLSGAKRSRNILSNSRLLVVRDHLNGHNCLNGHNALLVAASIIRRGKPRPLNYSPLPSNYSHPLRPKAVPLTPQNSPQAQRYPNKTPRHASSRKKMRVTKSKFVTLIFGKVYSASIRLCRYHRYTRQRKNPIPKRSTAARSSSSLTLGSAIEISSLARSANDLLRR